jgi:hypothetical protein
MPPTLYLSRAAVAPETMGALIVKQVVGYLCQQRDVLEEHIYDLFLLYLKQPMWKQALQGKSYLTMDVVLPLTDPNLKDLLTVDDSVALTPFYQFCVEYDDNLWRMNDVRVELVTTDEPVVMLARTFAVDCTQRTAHTALRFSCKINV